MNPALDLLQPYPFERLRKLFAGVTPASDKNHIALSIGEPKHASPAFVRKRLDETLGKLANYPTTRGVDELRESIATWLTHRFCLANESVDPARHVLPVNGTREALFAIAQAVVDRSVPDPLVMMPNPFYQIYEGAALLAGAQPYLLATTEDKQYLPDWHAVPDAVWAKTQLVYVCSPGNPAGSVIPQTDYQYLLEKSDEHGFLIAADECYSEIYPDEAAPPIGLLQVCANTGRNDFRNVLVFHSLSKRSNLPGLRSGFVAGDADVIAKFFNYRTYQGCAMPIQNQLASAVAWADEEHVKSNRQQYRDKYACVAEILSDCFDARQPNGSFYLWPRVPIDDQRFASELFAQEHITVLPGSYLSRDMPDGTCPGRNHVRIALVANQTQCIEAAERLARFWSQF